MVVMFQDFNFYQNFLEVLVDNDGDMIIVVECDNYCIKREDYYFEFYYYDGRIDCLIWFDLIMLEKLIFDVIFFIDLFNKRIVGVGFYFEKNFGCFDGFFYLNINFDWLEDFVKASYFFMEEFIVSFFGKEVDKIKGVLEGLLCDVVLCKDGGVFFIGEFSWIFECNGVNMIWNFYDGIGWFLVDYYYDEIFVLFIYLDGDLYWLMVMYKK